MSNSEMILNSEKAVLAKYILSIESADQLDAVKRRLGGLIHIRINQTSFTNNILDSISGKWEDDRTADEMVNDIYSARKSQSLSDYISPFEA